MVKQFEGKKYSQAVNILIFIFPIVINSMQVAGDIVLFILAMMGIFTAISQKISPFVIKEIKVFSFLSIGYFSAVCLSVLFSGTGSELAHYIPRDFHFLFGPFIALALYKAKINISYLFVGVKIALIILGIIIICQLLYTDTVWIQRPSGIMNPSVFGNISVSLFFIALISIQNQKLKQKLFTLLALLSGLFIIIASGTRGSWLSFIFLSGVYLYFFYRQEIKLKILSKTIIFIIIVAVVSIISFNQPIKDRVYSTYSETANWLAGERSNLSSAGLRLDMYLLAIDKIEDVPLFGHGYRTSNIVVFKDATSIGGRLSYSFNHLHNAYLTNYFNGGIFLLGALLFVLFVPLVIFLKANIQDRSNPIFISGALLIMGYSSYGMVNILLGDTYMNGFYIFFLALFLTLTNKSSKV